MNITLFTPHQGQKQVINNFSDSEHKFGTVVTSRQWGKSLLGQNLLLYWLLGKSSQEGISRIIRCLPFNYPIIK